MTEKPIDLSLVAPECSCSIGSICQGKHCVYFGVVIPWNAHLPIEPDPTTRAYSIVSINPTSRDNDMFAVPRWVLRLLAEQLTAETTCGGENYEPGCPICGAIRVAKEASESGI